MGLANIKLFKEYFRHFIVVMLSSVNWNGVNYPTGYRTCIETRHRFVNLAPVAPLNYTLNVKQRKHEVDY